MSSWSNSCMSEYQAPPVTSCAINQGAQVPICTLCAARKSASPHLALGPQTSEKFEGMSHSQLFALLGSISMSIYNFLFFADTDLTACTSLRISSVLSTFVSCCCCKFERMRKSCRAKHKID